jgi:transposase
MHESGERAGAPGSRHAALRAWTKRHREASGAGIAIPGETVEQENRRLRREVAVLRQEQAFAKKAAVNFAKESR